MIVTDYLWSIKNAYTNLTINYMRNISLFLILLTLPLFISISSYSNNVNDDRLLIEGELAQPIFRTPILPIEAYYSSEQLCIIFNKNLGIIKLTIYDETNNVVFNNVIMSEPKKNYHIDMSQYKKGQYKVVLTNDQNKFCFAHLKKD